MNDLKERRELWLQRIKICSESIVIRELPFNEFECYIRSGGYDDVLGRVLVAFSTAITGLQENNQDYCVELKLPSNDYQKFKKKLPKWFQKRFPIKYTTHKRIIKIDAAAYFPELRMSNDFGRIIINATPQLEGGVYRV